MPILSKISQKKKIIYFLNQIKKTDRVLEVGAGSGWVSNYFNNNDFKNYTGLDIQPPADIVGDIKDWKKLGLLENSYDYIIAFEVIEHVDCINECYKLLNKGGKLFITTPIPASDWFLKILEFLSLNQKRTSPHLNLTNLKKIDAFKHSSIKYIALLSQWAIFTK